MSLKFLKNKIRFDRNELAGAFGDIGTDLPLIIGMILASGLNATSVFIAFGLMQVITAFTYGMPMPVQPLKVFAAIVISQQIEPGVIYGGGLAIGVTMLLLSVSGLIDVITRTIPKVVVRGIQFGLGLQLCQVALKQYVVSESVSGYILAAVSFLLTLLLIGNRRFPPAIFIILLGVLYAMVFNFPDLMGINPIEITLPAFHQPTWDNIVTGFLLLALPQLPLSIGNAIAATHQITRDLFPEKNITVRKIGFTYSVLNIINPFIGGVPCCHGSGGIAGHYAFGGRTGGSVLIYGMIYLVIGLLFSSSFGQVVKIFPMPVLGVILVFEGLYLMIFIKDIIDSKKNFFIALLVGVMAVGLPYGYLIGIVVGTVIYYVSDKHVKNYFKLGLNRKTDVSD